jgi:hypothetical protein
MLKARELLAWDEAKGVKDRRLLAGGREFEEIARPLKVEGVDLVGWAVGGAVGGVDKIFFGRRQNRWFGRQVVRF